jgi:ectoine hydroxylase-related dioxygenase (phytanoyl-CoA dioxygenase family)
MSLPPLRAVTADEHAAFVRDGVVHLERMLDPDEVAAMAEPVERALASDQATDLGLLVDDDDDQGGARFVAGVDHWRHDDAFRRFACDSALPEVAASLLASDTVALYEDSVLVKEPGSPYRTEFHTDAAYFHIAGDQACTFWVPLDEVSVDTGAVQYVKGSHRWDRRFRPHLFTRTDPIPGTEGEEVPDVWSDPDLQALLVGFHVAPGDVVVHHYRTLHGAGANTSDATRRRAISVRYCGDDVRYRFQPGAPRKGHHERVREGDPLGDDDAPLVWPASTDR